MGFVPAICSQCGGKIQVDTDREKNYCMHCGTLFIVEDVLRKSYDPLKETIDSALYRIKEMSDYDGAMQGLKSVESQASNKATYWWAVLDAKTHHFSHFEDEDDIKESFDIINRVSSLGTITEEQYDLFYAYMVLCMKMAKQMSMYYVQMDTSRSKKTQALMEFTRFFAGRKDERSDHFFSNYVNNELKNEDSFVTNKANSYYNVYKRLESVIETFDAGDKSLTWDPLFVASGACWTEFAELRG